MRYADEGEREHPAHSGGLGTDGEEVSLLDPSTDGPLFRWPSQYLITHPFAIIPFASISESETEWLDFQLLRDGHPYDTVTLSLSRAREPPTRVASGHAPLM